MEGPTGAWRLVRGWILRAPNWAGQGQAVWERERGVSLKIWVLERRKMEGVWELMVKGAFQVT